MDDAQVFFTEGDQHHVWYTEARGADLKSLLSESLEVPLIFKSGKETHEERL